MPLAHCKHPEGGCCGLVACPACREAAGLYKKVLAIVGSVSLSGREDVYQAIQEAIEWWRPTKIVSGGAVGVDTMAAEVAASLEIPYEEFLPETRRWEDGFKPRNLKIAEACDCLCRFAAKTSRTYGSGWTRDRAAELGKPTEEVVFE